MGNDMKNNTDKLIIGGHEFNSRFILGSGKYSLDLIKAAIENAGAEIITLALRRANLGGSANILDYIPKNVTLLPNTSGARNAEEAVRIARLAREIGCGDFIKIEVIRDSKYLLPDNYERRICSNALYVSRPKCCKRYGKCRSFSYYASCCTYWIKQRIKYR